MKGFIVKKIKKVKVKNGILIEGFPGVGNVARIVVDFLINKLKAKKFLEIYSYYFPNSVILTETHEVEMPKIEFYYYKRKSGDLVIAVGDVQPSDEYASYVFSEKILEIASSLGIKEIITLGGITSKIKFEKPDVYGAYTDKKYVKKLEKLGVKFRRKGSIIVIGAAGLLLGLGKLRKIKGFSLLAETFIGEKFGINAAKEILYVLLDYLNLKISRKEIELELREVKRIPRIIKKKVIKKIQKQPLTYIG